MFFKSKSTYDWLIVGLGNPGITYENTRHNVGFITVDKLAQKENFSFNKIKFSAKIGEYKLKDSRILVIKPETYMNNSGKAVLEASSFYKIPSDRIIVIQDDISLVVGKLRIRRKGSDGGQKGMRDIIELLGTDNIARIKIGVGAKPHPDYNLADWVLSKFKAEEKEPLNNACDNAVLAIKEIITRSIDSAMNKYNS
ncbi:MAG: aminoacyl-tRNA hydrolase [Clostridia bacterium]|nr:aminoacyl-tRNA hydrolase [Clostridia bacterium]